MADPLEDLLRDCTVRVTGGPMPGAGFFVAPGKVLTCVHVIGDSAALGVRWERDGQPALEVPVSGRVAALADPDFGIRLQPNEADPGCKTRRYEDGTGATSNH